MKRAGVIGWPIEHSRSPLIHGHWLKTYGIDGQYTREAVPPGDVAEFLTSLKSRGFVGCNVTVPHKEAAFAVAEIKHPSALAVGAANTIWYEGSRLACANTDTYGFMTHLTASAPQWFDADAPVSVLGAGGAARAIVFGFLEAGVGDVRVFNRSRDRADAIVKQFGTRVRAFDWDERTAQTVTSRVVVNTTALGMKGQPDLDFDVAGLPPNCVVADIVYVPLETRLLHAARGRGLRTVDGLGMLLHQAAPGFETWFGIKPEVTGELRALIEADIQGRA